MTEIYLAADPNAPARAAVALEQGEIIVMPTDTVYGIASRLADDAILRLYLAKDRPPDKAIPILLADASDVEQVVSTVTPQARRLLNAFWPGPLTLVLPKRADLPNYVSNTPTVGVRIPDSDIAREIIRAAGGALAVTSANRSGQPPALTVTDALAQLGEHVAVAVNGGPSDGDSPSTVAQLDGGQITILRPGPITLEELEKVLHED
ncbi:MAG: threonylcarbamoyl-AMP synthase [Chloroflexi bacterium]|nr:threonylcarbamoyl-AMP synthase [Chloroflexota bacterium]